MVERAAIFEQHRQRLQTLAYRMLGSVSDAQDAVQEASLRWIQSAETKMLVPEGPLFHAQLISVQWQ